MILDFVFLRLLGIILIACQLSTANAQMQTLAFGPNHTTNYNSIMYFFGYGGDIPRFFLRYRSELETRKDIEKHPGLSENDIQEFQNLYSLERIP